MTRVCPSTAQAKAAAGSSGMPSSLARPLPEPLGMTAIRAALKASAEPTSFTVPSPPQATISDTPRVTIAVARSRACPPRSVTKISASTRRADSSAAARSAR